MKSQFNVIYCLNQFFGGLGGEEKASLPPELVKGPKGPGVLLQKLFPDLLISDTLIFGDNYVAENTTSSIQEILALMEPCFSLSTAQKPDLLLAGPAFNAGRYGLACGALCTGVRDHFGIPVITAMYPENPAVDEYRRDITIVKTGADVRTLEEAGRRY